MRALAALRIIARIVVALMKGQHMAGSWQTTLGGVLLGIGTPLSATGQGAYRDMGIVLAAIGGILLGVAAPSVSTVKRLEKSVNERLAERQRK